MSDTPTEAELREAFNASTGIAPNSACRLGNWKECFDAFKRGAQYRRRGGGESMSEKNPRQHTPDLAGLVEYLELRYRSYVGRARSARGPGLRAHYAAIRDRFGAWRDKVKEKMDKG